MAGMGMKPRWYVTVYRPAGPSLNIEQILRGATIAASKPCAYWVAFIPESLRDRRHSHKCGYQNKCTKDSHFDSSSQSLARPRDQQCC